MGNIVPKIVEDMFHEYSQVPVPYFQWKNGRSLKKSLYKGKGSIAEIKNKLMELKLNSPTSINKTDRQLLIENNIGIDCSGFIMRIYNQYTIDKFNKNIWEFYPNMKSRIIGLFKDIKPWLINDELNSDLDANTLSNKKYTLEIENISEARPMDIIRLSGGKHIVLIYKLNFRNKNVLKGKQKAAFPDTIEYIHSTEGVGVCKGIINITAPEKSIVNQEWIKDQLKAKYDPEYLIRYKANNNGIRRPFFLNN